MDFLFLVETKGFEPLTSAMRLQRSKPAGLRLYFRLANAKLSILFHSTKNSIPKRC